MGAFPSKKSKEDPKNPINLKPEQLQQLEEWTGLKGKELIFDTETDTFDTLLLNKKIIGRRNLVFCVEDWNNEMFGGFITNQISDQCCTKIKMEEKSFMFNLESQGRLQGPMKFEIKSESEAYYRMSDSYDMLFHIGDLAIFDDSHGCRNSQVIENSDNFDYHGIESALRKKDMAYRYGQEKVEKTFKVTRTRVIQME